MEGKTSGDVNVSIIMQVVEIRGPGPLRGLYLEQGIVCWWKGGGLVNTSATTNDE